MHEPFGLAGTLLPQPERRARCKHTMIALMRERETTPLCYASSELKVA
jgi:hypothetical protein